MMSLMKTWSSVVFLILAIIFSFVLPHAPSVMVFGSADSLFFWLLFFSVGLQGVWNWLEHGFNEASHAYLGMGIAGIVALWFAGGYWLCLTIVSTFPFLCTVFLHIKKTLSGRKGAATGGFKLVDLVSIIVPVALWVTVIMHFA